MKADLLLSSMPTPCQSSICAIAHLQPDSCPSRTGTLSHSFICRHMDSCFKAKCWRLRNSTCVLQPAKSPSFPQPVPCVPADLVATSQMPAANLSSATMGGIGGGGSLSASGASSKAAAPAEAGAVGVARSHTAGAAGGPTNQLNKGECLDFKVTFCGVVSSQLRGASSCP